ncbi:TPA: hypothetical protein ACKP22_000955 [Pseudomonas putida]
MDYPKSVPNVGLVAGKFVDENTTTGQVGSLIPAVWGNAVTQEILGVIAAAGLVPDESNNAQLAQAIDKVINTAVPQATQTVAGKAKIADTPTVTAGTNDSTIVTPLRLASRLAGAGPVVGSVRNGRMSNVGAAASGVFIADEVLVQSSLGGSVYKINSLNKTVNLATVGAGGMDTGQAPVNGWIALYVIYNPTSGASALLAKDASTAVQPETYGGANMPVGYTASALVAILATDSSRLLAPHVLQDRKVFVPYRPLAAPSSVQPVLTAFSAPSIPYNARSIDVLMSALSTVAPAHLSMSLSPAAIAIGSAHISGTAGVAFNGWGGVATVPVLTPQTLYYTSACSAGTPTFNFGTIAFNF